MWPNKRYDKTDDDEEGSQPSPVNDKDLELQPTSPRMVPYTPYTPRTQAFHTLDRKLPLREMYQ